MYQNYSFQPQVQSVHQVPEATRESTRKSSQGVESFRQDRSYTYPNPQQVQFQTRLHPPYDSNSNSQCVGQSSTQSYQNENIINKLDYFELVELLLNRDMSLEHRAMIQDKLVQMNNYAIEQQNTREKRRDSHIASPSTNTMLRIPTLDTYFATDDSAKYRQTDPQRDRIQSDISRSTSINHRKKDLVDTGFPSEANSNQRSDLRPIALAIPLNPIRTNPIRTPQPIQPIQPKSDIDIDEILGDINERKICSAKKISVEGEALDDKLKRLNLLKKKIIEDKKQRKRSK